MKIFSIPGTPQTPTIKLDSDKGFLEISGNSICNKAIDFYKPLMEYLEIYTANPKAETNVNIRFDYFDTDSSKCILAMFKKLEVLNKNNNKIVINWLYKTDDMLNTGEDYQLIINVPFKMIQVAK